LVDAVLSASQGLERGGLLAGLTKGLANFRFIHLPLVMGQDFREKGRWLARNVLPHEPVIRARLARLQLYGLEIDDIIQETYARIVSLSSLDLIRYPRQYAIQVATAIIIDHMRHTRVISISASGSLEQLDVSSPEAGPEKQLEFREEITQVAHFLATLPPITRETLILRRVEGLSQQETARRLGISVKTVEKHMARGVLMLMDLFGRGGKIRSRPSMDREQAPEDDKEISQPGD
jgi:RNA polymerase sigma factor (sigma-70 family)